MSLKPYFNCSVRMEATLPPAWMRELIALPETMPPVVSPRVNWFAPESAFRSLWNMVIRFVIVELNGWFCIQFQFSPCMMRSPSMMSFSQSVSASASMPEPR